MWQLFSGNSLVVLLLSAGALTLGLVTALVLVENGAIVSYSVIKASDRMSIRHVVMSLAPHGLFEVFATLLAGSAGFITLFIVIAKLDRRSVVRFRASLVNFFIMTGLSLLLLLPAAAAEYFVSAGITR